jgi:hypothetical protein
MMPKRLALAFLAVLVSTGTLIVGPSTVLAQATTPALPPAPQPTPRLPPGSAGGSSNYVVSAAANEHGSFLWVVDSIQHIVTLCEKSDTKDFTCTKKPLP